jgi:hypothetical protein
MFFSKSSLDKLFIKYAKRKCNPSRKEREAERASLNYHVPSNDPHDRILLLDFPRSAPPFYSNETIHATISTMMNYLTDCPTILTYGVSSCSSVMKYFFSIVWETGDFCYFISYIFS